MANQRQRVVLGETVSEWKEVTSGVPQGSVLGPMLFLFFINDMPERFVNNCKLYADDSKIIAIIKKVEDTLVLQRDINALSDWTKDWLMRLNIGKCKVMYLGGSESERVEYTIEDIESGLRVPLEETNCEKDLGILISDDLRWKNHINSIAAKANRVLGMLLKTFTSRDMNLWKLLYVSLVRPHLEFASTVWNPYLVGDIETLEKVQRRATRISPEMRSLEYEDRLKRWGLTSLKERRVRGDLIQMYKVRNNIEDINWQAGPLNAPHTNTRGEAQNNSSQRVSRPG